MGISSRIAGNERMNNATRNDVIVSHGCREAGRGLGNDTMKKVHKNAISPRKSNALAESTVISLDASLNTMFLNISTSETVISTLANSSDIYSLGSMFFDQTE
jgi:hypothetical protein